MSLLSNVQKARLSILAKQAYAAAQRHHATDDLSADDWRAREAVSVVGVRISGASNDHYLALRRHFENLAGNAGRAFNTAIKEQEEPIARGRRLVAEALAHWSLNPGYAETIARGNRFKKPGGVQSLDEDELKQLLYIINNRGRAKARPGMPHDRNKLQNASRNAPAPSLQDSSTAPADIAGPWPR